MSKVKAIIDFTDYKAADLGVAASIILERMQENAVLFPEPIVSLGVLAERLQDYEVKLVLRMSNATEAVLALRESRRALEKTLRMLGGYVNIVANGSADLVEKSGFPSYTAKYRRDLNPPPAPADLRLRHGKVSGTVHALYTPPRQHCAHEIQIHLGNPSDESGWVTNALYKGGRALLKGLTPGALIWVRVRASGVHGIMGAWSDTAQIRVV